MAGVGAGESKRKLMKEDYEAVGLGDLQFTRGCTDC